MIFPIVNGGYMVMFALDDSNPSGLEIAYVFIQQNVNFVAVPCDCYVLMLLHTDNTLYCIQYPTDFDVNSMHC